ncbi:succinate dehydrogenase assembly factor 2 [Lutimaribacter sp. EGI FJ00015]|uniref:Succinate dehydrogenase assembly factor 2 n=1 Tax=Lutimaribacter degradans TaxID=2945989 RepID=A0ACC5ZSW3_9RHOB|nr:succinate dehydrogenase assembly factor 2 [Lutimaribacter sp. EGI FJ00013]MCM2561377.1 succinate dehydrogenase assembly factor 2 [Lutimaribacter sp. EGI FJ00013]MCO0612913.1 succinate dehydrogenase assembly factor 2 [Lutimaribacter sp. EGI FJ00015]MCO0635571.1 succinate dehydrogenase assembly factor 2 [Lutimaribacter sp. EGI FJ00014]
MIEPRDIRLKRLRMRSMRRGIKEMDMILIRYSQARLDALPEAELDVYESLLSENDQDLYQWVSGQAAPPGRFSALIGDIRDTIGNAE